MDKSDRRWLRAELKARDRATDVAREELNRQLGHLNRLREEAVDKEFYFREHQALRDHVEDALAAIRNAYDEDIEALETRMTKLEGHLQRISGTYVGYAAVGALFIAAVSAIIAHLIGS